MDKHAQVNQDIDSKGVYIFTTAFLETPEHYALNDKITKMRNKGNELMDIYDKMSDKLFFGLIVNVRREAIGRKIDQNAKLTTAMIRELNTICKTKKEVYKNIVPTVGRAMIANNLGNVSPTNVMYIKYAEVGTGTNAPANADTALQTSTYRNALASRTNASNITYATAFFNATETSGTFREAGIFSDGTASAGTGVLVSRVAINVTKTTSNTLTIDWTLTLS